MPVMHENSVQNAEHNLNYILLLKNLLDVIPELGKILLAGESDLLRRIQKVRVNFPPCLIIVRACIVVILSIFLLPFRNWKETNFD